MKSPRQAISKAFLKSPVSRAEIEVFKDAFATLQQKVDPNETEEHLKNNIRDFLLDAKYRGEYEIIKKSRFEDGPLVIEQKSAA